MVRASSGVSRPRLDALVAFVSGPLAVLISVLLSVSVALVERDGPSASRHGAIVGFAGEDAPTVSAERADFEPLPSEQESEGDDDSAQDDSEQDDEDSEHPLWVADARFGLVRYAPRSEQGVRAYRPQPVSCELQPETPPPRV